MARRIKTMHLNGPAEGEAFMAREGVDPNATPDDKPEWLDNERNMDPADAPDDDLDDEDLDDEEDEDED